MEAQAKNPFTWYDLKKLGNDLDFWKKMSKEKQILEAKFFILEHNLKNPISDFANFLIIEMFEEIIEESSEQEHFERLIKIFTNIKNEEFLAKSYDYENHRTKLFRKIMEKWITGEDPNCNYFITDYYNGHRSMEIYQRAGTDPGEFRNILYAAVKRQIVCLIEKGRIEERKLHFWGHAYKSIELNKHFDNDFFNTFKKAYHNFSEAKLHTFEKEANENTNKFSAYMNLISRFKQTYFVRDSAPDQKKWELIKSFKEKSFEFLKTVSVNEERTAELIEDLKEESVKRDINLSEEIMYFENKILDTVKI